MSWRDGSTFAVSLRDSVNTAHAVGYDRTGAPGGPVFAGTTARDLTLAPTLTSAGLAAAGSPTVAPYDGENARRVALLRQSDASGDSLGNRLTGLAGLLGSRGAGAARIAGAADTALDGAPPSAFR